MFCRSGFAIVFMLTMTPSLFACGYGAYDADIESYCSGDPMMSQAALNRILKRGKGVLNLANRYKFMVQIRQNSYERHIKRLETRPEDYKMTEEQFIKAIDSAKKYLEWNAKRKSKIDGLIFMLNGGEFAGEPWSIHSNELGA